MKRKNILLSLALSCSLLCGGHFYLEWMIKEVIQDQIETNKDRIKDEMKKEIFQSLEEDEETQRQVQNLMQNVVAIELENNGDKHIRQIIRTKYPFLEAFLAANEQKTK